MHPPLSALFEIFILALGLYYAYRTFKGTQSGRLLYGLMVGSLFLAAFLWISQSDFLHNFFYQNPQFLLLMLLILFQPEIRRFLNELGLLYTFSRSSQDSFVIEHVVRAVEELKSRNMGALIAFDPHVEESMVTQSGVRVDAAVKEELLCTIFTNKTPLHDGGVILSAGRIHSAGCIFPLSYRENLNRQAGLRHRAALGLSEEKDVTVVVLSEETGDIAICRAGQLEHNLKPEDLRLRLNQILLPHDQPKSFQQAIRYWITNPPLLARQTALEFLACITIAVLLWLIFNTDFQH